MSSPAPRLEPIPPGGSLARQFATILLLVVTLAVSLTFLFVQLPQTPVTGHSTLVLVWSGMRPDMVTSNLTPNLYALGNQGVEAIDHHAAYPTTALVNAAVMATGDNPGTTKAGSGNGSGQIAATTTVPEQDTGIPDDMPFWLLPGTATTATPTAGATSTVTATTPQATATNSSHATPSPTARSGATTTPKATATPIPATPTPTATPAPNGVADLTQDQTQIALQQSLPGGLVHVPSVAQEALGKGMSVSYEGTNGVALLQSLGAVTQARSRTYVIDDQMDYPTTLTQQMATAGVTPPSQLPPIDAQHAPDTARGEAFTQAFLKVLLPTFKTTNAPFFSVITYPDPALTASLTGIGSAQQIAAIQADDHYLGEIIDGLRQDNALATTNIIVTSDHGMDDVIQPGNSSAAGQAGPASAQARTDMLTLLLTASAKGVQGPLPDVTPASVSTGAVTDATLVVLVANGGMDAISIPMTPALTTLGNGDVTTARALLAREIVTWLQQVPQVGPIFVNDNLSNHIAGILPLSALMLAGDRAPAIAFSFTTHALDVGNRATNLEQLGGSTYADTTALATSGTLSRRDLHTIFYAQGPGFKQGVRDTAPTGAIDMAPTVENLLGLNVPSSQQGRSLDEVLANGPDSISTSSKDPAVSSEANVAGNTFFLEVVEYATNNGVVYIQDAYAIHSTTPQSPDDLKNQALTLGRQE